jgi:hypothetical protein
MTPTPLRSLRPALLTVALAGLAVSVGWHRPATDPPGEPPTVCMDGWSVPDLVRHLEARGLGLCAMPTWKGGTVIHNAFLTVPGKLFEELAGLPKDRASLDRWAGVVYCEECPRIAARDLQCLWGDCSLRAGPFVFFGDRDLLGRIREALLDSPPSGGVPGGS